MRNILLVAGAAALASAAGACVTGGDSPAIRTVRPPTLCSRRPAGFHQLAAELNRVLNCQGARMCYRGAWANLEVKEIAGYTLSDWLWTGPTPATFTVAQQNAFIATAQARALAARPPSKGLRNISFFTDLIVPSQGGGYFLGARATYGTCRPVSLPS